MLKKIKRKLMGSILITILLSIFICFSIYADETVPGELYIIENKPECACGKLHVENELYEQALAESNSVSLISETEEQDLPSSVDLSDDIYFPRIGNQVGGTCAAWATTYYQFTYEVARLNNWDAKNNMEYVFSPKFVWNFINNNEDEGVYKFQCYNILKKQGAVRWNECPGTDDEFGYYQATTYEETVSNLRKALENRVSSYCATNTFYGGIASEPVITSYNDSDLYEMKALLNAGHPLVISTIINCHYTVELDNKEILCIYQRETEEAKEQELNGSHAMTIVGYDDSICFDLNGDNDIQDYEKGAFKLANSWGTEDYGNDGYIWILYDALNLYSNVEALNFEDRTEVFFRNSYCNMTVKNYDPKVTAEVTLNFKNRLDLQIDIEYDEYRTTPSAKGTFFTGDYAQVNSSGGTEYQSYTFLVDFGTIMEENSEYTYNSHRYKLIIKDMYENDSVINIEKIRWVDENGNVFKEIVDAGSVDGNSITLDSVIQISSIDFDKEEQELYSYEDINLQCNILPANATKTDLIWTSSVPTVATVDNEGNVTYVGAGETVITARTTDGTNLTALCIITTHDDYSDEKDRAKQVRLHSTTPGEIEIPYDVDYFKFIAPRTGKYVFNSEGYTDTITYVYNSNNSVIGYNDDYSEDGYYNFAVSCDLVQGETYYIKVIAYSGDVGQYDLVVREVHEEWLICDIYYDLNKFQMEGRFAAIFDKVEIQMGNSVYTVNLPSDYSDLNFTVNGIEFYTNFDRVMDGLYVFWDIEAYFPETYTEYTENIICTFSKDNLSVIIDMSNY